MARERMCRQRFLQECAVAWTAEWGVTPSDDKLNQFAELWKRIELLDDGLRAKEGPPPRPPATT